MPSLTRVMSSRPSISPDRRSVSLSIDSKQRVVLLGVKCADGEQQARRGGLDRGQRGAQVVADRGQQRRAQLVGLAQLGPLARLALQPLALEHRDDLGGDPPQEGLALRVLEAAGHDQLVGLIEGDRDRRSGQGPATTTSSGVRLTVIRAAQGGPVQLEGPHELGQEVLEGLVAQAHGRDQPGQRPGVALRDARPARCAVRRGPRASATVSPATRNTVRASDVAGVGDREACGSAARSRSC